MNFKDKVLQNKKLSTLIDFVKQDKTNTFIVGGWVRDLIMDIECDDMDIVVEGDGISFALRFAEFIGLKDKVVVFERFGTAKIMSSDWEFDFVGARKESYDAESRNPTVAIGTIKDDQLRRDLTINAMAISLNEETLGDLVDPFDGLSDIKNKVIQTPIDPVQTFTDDPLRMLRAIRFSCRFNFEMNKNMVSSITNNRHRLSIISAERILTELDKILLSSNPLYGLNLLEETGLLEIVLPEVTALKGIEVINGVKHKDNLLHTFQVVKNTREVTNDISLLWVALLHDIGKAKTKVFEGNSWKFAYHEKVGAKMIKKIAERLKWDNERLEKVTKITELHGIPKELIRDGVTDSAIRRFVIKADSILEDLITFCLCDITTKSEEKMARQKAEIISLKDRVFEIAERDQLRNFTPPVSGEWIMETFNLKPSRQVGQFKEAVKEAILNGELKNDETVAQAFCFTISKNILK